jgi:hypothetical protein
MRDAEISTGERTIRPLASRVNSNQSGGTGMAISKISDLDLRLEQH